MKIEASIFKQAMRQCAGAVAVVTVGTKPRLRTGLTVTSACSLSDNPPSLLVCVNRNASAHARIREEGCFAVNFLSEEHMPLALTFSGQKGISGDDRFALGRWIASVTGSPLLEDAAVAFDCMLTQEFETTTHSVFIGEVRDARLSAETYPLIYLRSGFKGVRDIQGQLSLADLDARRLSWSRFS
ncbi:flavin reductase family protein [Bradyrhizobium sp. JYMT SZCCT0428]|uniref:flavin reductase family protein n=1 Tax=Bradyrhizobium sp. JYMT SZCCT0428 TaxID=2807673 RepID=UPI001BACBE05|nr:flavin reductase family protein [Bradyrhizobium sp. JYMT SZCCT0428]MBR1149465.1 flavin reductase family protein [Bradyrhizobium sp. JYMT SZCCT0428]